MQMCCPFCGAMYDDVFDVHHCPCSTDSLQQQSPGTVMPDQQLTPELEPPKAVLLHFVKDDAGFAGSTWCPSQGCHFGTRTKYVRADVFDALRAEVERLKDQALDAAVDTIASKCEQFMEQQQRIAELDAELAKAREELQVAREALAKDTNA